MSQANPKAIFYRSKRYNVIDPYRLDGNTVLPELLSKQASNRYFNAQANHLTFRPELISVLEDISIKLEYSDDTYYLSVSMMDALLSLYSVD